MKFFCSVYNFIQLEYLNKETCQNTYSIYRILSTTFKINIQSMYKNVPSLQNVKMKKGYLDYCKNLVGYKITYHIITSLLKS